MWSQSHQLAHHYPRSCRKATQAGIRAMAGQSLHMRCEIWTLSMTNMIRFNVYFHLSAVLMFQGIYSHAVDPAQRRGNSQPDLLNVKAQKDAFGWHRYTQYK